MATVLFMPESAYGPTNNCIGIGDVLRRRGHRVVFAAEASWRGKLEPLGFEEDLVDLAPPPADGADGDAGQFWKDFIRDTAPEFRKPTIEQLGTWIRPVWEELTGGARYCQRQLTEIIERTRPDVIVEDNVVSFPALLTAGVPFVRIVSCNPLELPDPGIPPAFSGYPAADPAGWQAFRDEYERVCGPLWAEFSAWVTEQGAPPLPYLEFIHPGAVNLYVYPELADYPRARGLGPSWHRLDSSVRETDEKFAVPEALAGRPGALIYFSLGSLGSADVALMRRVLACLAGTPHSYIVSKGPLHDEIELPVGMAGAQFLPQTSVIPAADLVITHGGNNTVTECLHFGKPMIVLPLFWDQHDNAQRVQELGLGVRLDPYRFTGAQLHGAIEALLADAALRGRLAAAAAMIQRRDGVRKAAGLIERAAAGLPAVPPQGRPGRHPIPWVTQYATPSLITAIVYGGHPPGDDPNWRDSGAATQEAYGRWCSHLCGMACLRMALIGRDGHAPTLFALLGGCLAYGGYVEEPDGRVTGLRYQQFSDFTRDRYGLRADVITELGPERMIAELDQGRLVMASVHPEIRRPEHDPPATGGHLVLVTGHDGGQLTFHNPSGHTRQAGIAALPVARFYRFAARRGLALHL